MVDDINVTKFVIESQALLSGYSYEARVRMRGPVGLWSDWSPRVVWTTEEVTSNQFTHYFLMQSTTWKKQVVTYYHIISLLLINVYPTNLSLSYPPFSFLLHCITEGVNNLQCVITELGLKCNWQVKKWQAEFFSYHLCGHNNGTNLWVLLSPIKIQFDLR